MRAWSAHVFRATDVTVAFTTGGVGRERQTSVVSLWDDAPSLPPSILIIASKDTFSQDPTS
jgi:hypothetical protein